MRKHIKNVLLTVLMIGLLTAAFSFAPAVSASENPLLELEVIISLTDHPADFSEDYTIIIEAADDENPMPEGSENGIYKQAVSDTDAVALEEIVYTKPGIYDYVVTQQAGSADRWTYDSRVYDIRVYITNNEAYDGLDMNVVIREQGSEIKTDIILFENIYDPLPAVYELTAKKTMDGKTPKSGEFQFVLKDEEGNVVETVSNTDAVISFTDIVYDEEGVYTYTLSEITGSNKRIKYDTTVYTITVTVTQDGDLVTDVVYEKNGKEYDGELIFKNITGPPMGDDTNIGLWIGIFAVSLIVIVLLLVLGKKRNKE